LRFHASSSNNNVQEEEEEAIDFGSIEVSIESGFGVLEARVKRKF
jgi:hypothetical protein